MSHLGSKRRLTSGSGNYGRLKNEFDSTNEEDDHNIRQWLQGPMFKVYLSHSLSSWGDRMWLFAGGIFMQKLSGTDSLLLAGIYTFALSGVVLTFGGVVGRWVDKTPRLAAAQKALLAQNLTLLLCATTIFFMFTYWTTLTTNWHGWIMIFLQATAILTATLSKLASVATTIILQQDWVVILAEGDTDRLATINSTFRSIDLTTLLIAPIIVGLIQGGVSSVASIVFIGVWNLISMCFEYLLLWLIYRQNPQLAIKTPPKVHSERCAQKYADHDVCPELEVPENFAAIRFHYYAMLYDWTLYFQQPVKMAGIGLALLYMTVLGFDAITIAYGSTQLSTTIIALVQGIAAAIGMLGSLSFPALRRCMGLNTVGILGQCFQVLALTACLVSIWLPGSPFTEVSIDPSWRPPYHNNTVLIHPELRSTPERQIHSVAALFGGIAVSRFGLYLVDITITQIFQERIDEHRRGVVNGVQGSLNMGMDMMKSILVIIYSYPQQFGYLVIISFVFICSGFLSFAMFCLQDQRFSPKR